MLEERKCPNCGNIKGNYGNYCKSCGSLLNNDEEKVEEVKKEEIIKKDEEITIVDTKRNTTIFHSLFWGTMVLSLVICFIIRIPITRKLLATVSPELIKNDYEIAASNTEVLVTKYNGEETIVEIPKEFDIYNNKFVITGIGANAFSNTSIESLTLPEGVTDIYSNAFGGCENLEILYLPDSIKRISEDAFTGCKIREYHGPAYALHFFNQENLDKVYITSGSMFETNLKRTTKLTYFEASDNVEFKQNLVCTIEEAKINAKAIRYLVDTYLKNVTVTSGEIPVTGFYGYNNLYFVTLEEGVTKIKSEAFKGTFIESINIPASCTYIEDSIFMNCKDLNNITVSANNLIYNSNNINGIVETDTSILICGCNNTILYEGIKGIGDGALSTFYKGEELILPSTVTYIGIGAFSYSPNLKNVVIPNGVTRIDNAAFAECKNLRTFVMPDSVDDLGTAVFSNCTYLNSIVLSNNITEIKNGLFYNCKFLENIEIPNKVKTIERDAFYGCSYLQSINLPDSINKIGNEAFRGCTSLKSATFPNKMLSLGSYLFADCKSLESFYYPEKNYSIPEYMFLNCNKLSEITLNDVIIIGEGAFMNCKSLTTVVLPDGLLYLYDLSFSYCDNLEYLYMGSEIKEIRDQAFVFTALKKVYYKGDEESFNKIMIGEHNGMLTNAEIIYNYNN